MQFVNRTKSNVKRNPKTNNERDHRNEAIEARIEISLNYCFVYGSRFDRFDEL